MPQTTSDTGKRVFLIHMAVYLAVNAGLVTINLMQTPEEGQSRELWFLWPLAGWGIGVAAHGLAVLFDRRAKEGDLFADKDVQGFAVHLFVYMAVNALLIAINLIVTPDSLWFYWPLLGWGAGLAAHAFLAYLAVTRRAGERYPTKQQPQEIQPERPAAAIASAITPEKKSAVEPMQKPARKPETSKAKRPAKKRAAAKAPSSKSTSAMDAAHRSKSGEFKTQILKSPT